MEFTKVIYNDNNVLIDITDIFKKEFKLFHKVYFNKLIQKEFSYTRYDHIIVEYTKNNINHKELLYPNSFFSENRIEDIKTILIKMNINEQGIYDYLINLDNNVDFVDDGNVFSIISHGNTNGIVFSRRDIVEGMYYFIHYYSNAINRILKYYKYSIKDVFGGDGFTLYKDNEDDNVFREMFTREKDEIFSPSEVVKKTITTFKNKYNINVDKCLGVYYRATDRAHSLSQNCLQDYIKTITSLNYDRILIQTDQLQVQESFFKAFGSKCIIIDELGTTNTNKGMHFVIEKNKLQTAIYFNSILRILAECHDLIINPISFGSKYVMKLRDSSKNSPYCIK